MKAFNSPIIVHISFSYHLIQLLIWHARAEKLANPDLTDTLFVVVATQLLFWGFWSIHAQEIMEFGENRWEIGNTRESIEVKKQRCDNEIISYQLYHLSIIKHQIKSDLRALMILTWSWAWLSWTQPLSLGHLHSCRSHEKQPFHINVFSATLVLRQERQIFQELPSGIPRFAQETFWGGGSVSVAWWPSGVDSRSRLH